VANIANKNYKNNKKNANYNTKAFWIGVGVISAVFVLTIIFVVWNPFKVRKYSGIKEITVPEIFTVNKDPNVTSYYVLFYKSYVNGTTNCTACMEAEPYVAEYAEKVRTNKGKIKPIYVINVRRPENSLYIAGSSDIEVLNNETDYHQIKVKYTPTLVLISANKISSSWNNKTDVLNELQREQSRLTTTGADYSTITRRVVLFKEKNYAFN
jgi:thiol-disulfide isomerase/thioredoxin